MDLTLMHIESADDVGFYTALYLINHGLHDEQHKLLCEACKWGDLDVVKKLVEQHNVDPSGEYSDCTSPHCTCTHTTHLIKCVPCLCHMLHCK